MAAQRPGDAPDAGGGAMQALAAEDKVYSDEKQCFCLPSELYFSQRPRLKSLFITCILLPATFGASLGMQQLAAATSKRGFELFLTWTTIQVCVCACVRACVCVSACACVRVRAHHRVCVCVCAESCTAIQGVF